MASCSLASLPRRCGAIFSLTFATARATPLPINRLPPSLSSTASCTPVDAPEGIVARPTTRYLSVTSTSTVGRSEEHTSELQSHHDHVCPLLLEKKKSQP